VLEASGRFSAVEVRRYPWQRSYTSAEWIGVIGTHSDHLRLDDGCRAALLTAAGAAIDALGGTIEPRFSTSAILATVPS
jgi:hypothetical protein